MIFYRQDLYGFFYQVFYEKKIFTSFNEKTFFRRATTGPLSRRPPSGPISRNHLLVFYGENLVLVDLLERRPEKKEYLSGLLS